LRRGFVLDALATRGKKLAACASSVMAQYGNWLGILKWSLQQSDGTSASNVAPMSEEVRMAK